MADQNPTILKTKLHWPPLLHIQVERSQLVEWLNQGIQSSLTLVVSVTGYGTSTLLGTWINRLAAGQAEDYQDPATPRRAPGPFASPICPSASLMLSGQHLYEIGELDN